jgi:hypothetical protein
MRALVSGCAVQVVRAAQCVYARYVCVHCVCVCAPLCVCALCVCVCVCTLCGCARCVGVRAL